MPRKSGCAARELTTAEQRTGSPTRHPELVCRARLGAAPAPDLTTVLRVENPVPPQVNADNTFFEFLFSGSPTTFAELNAKAERGEALASRTLSNVTASITIDNTFDVLTTQLSKNVVGMIEGMTDVQRERWLETLRGLGERGE